MNNSAVNLLLVLFCCSAFAQKLELGNVTKIELAESYHPKDTAAVAAVLFKKAKTTFDYSDENGFESVTEYSIKIKIYKKEGLKWANFEIPYYIGYEKLQDDVLTITQAATYNLENGKIDKVRVTSEGKFVENFNEVWKTKSVTFPNVKEGSIIELKYILKSQNLSILPDFQYQYKIPVNQAEYTTEIPEFYIYKAMRSGFVEVEMKEKLESTSQNYDEKVGLGKVSKMLSYKQIKTTYSANTIPALIEEDYVNSISNYFGKIEHELQLIRYPNEKPKQIATTWESVAKSIFEDKDFGAELLKNSYFLDDLRKHIGAVDSDTEKLEKTFNFVKNRMNWNGKYGFYTKTPIEKAYAERTGNVGEINLMLTAMLKMVGLNANPVLLSTRDNGIALFPNRTKFNYVIVAVEMGNNLILLDATSKIALPNILPIRDLNWVGRMIKNDGSSTEVNVMPKTLSKETVNVIATISSDGTLKGKLRAQLYDYNAYVYRDVYANLATDTQISRIESKYKGIQIADHAVTNASELDKPISESYSFEDTASVEIIGDKMYFSPLLFFATTENHFKQEKREYPIDFAFPNQDKYLITITIPENYVVESLPKSASIPINDNLGSLKYMVSNTDKTVQVSVTMDINYAIISADYYQELKAFFAEVVKKETEKVVLKKI